MFFTGWKPNDVAGMDFFDRPAEALRPAAAGGDDEGLTERMGVPRGACAGFEGDRCAAGAGGVGGFEEGIDADGAGEPVGWAAGAC